MDGSDCVTSMISAIRLLFQIVESCIQVDDFAFRIVFWQVDWALFATLLLPFCLHIFLRRFQFVYECTQLRGPPWYLSCLFFERGRTNYGFLDKNREGKAQLIIGCLSRNHDARFPRSQQRRSMWFLTRPRLLKQPCRQDVNGSGTCSSRHTAKTFNSQLTQWTTSAVSS